MKTIKKYVENLEIGSIQTYKNLAVAPILGEDGCLEHIVLADALQNGLEIREKGSGSVPTLFAVNKTGKNILAIEGEYIIGGKQNRTLTRNIYFSKNFEGEIPVRCVQHGRWGAGEEIDFPHHSMPDIVRPRPFPYPRDPGDPWGPEPYREPDRPFLNIRQPDVVFRHGGHAPLCTSLYSCSQGETWNAVDQILCCENVKSASGDLNAVYKERKDQFEKYIDKFPVVDGQIGNIAVISKNGRKTFVLDLFDREQIMGKYHQNLINSYALEAGLRAKNKVKTSEKEIRDFLDSADSCDFKTQNPVSVGKDYKISGTNIMGSALLFKGNLAYMNLFSKKNLNKGHDRISPITDNSSGEFSSGFYRTFG